MSDTHESDTITIGDWRFSPDTGSLQKDGVTQRLENRAAALLDFLVSRQGNLVSHADIIEKVWEGRFVSPNSVAVVISDIRRALGDDARKPSYIETLSKRGYRMIAQTDQTKSVSQTDFTHTPEPEPEVFTHRRWLAAVGLILGFAAVLIMLLPGTGQNEKAPAQGTLLVFVTGVEDKTQDVQYATLGPASAELIRLEISHIEHVRIATEADADLSLSGRLIIWDGHPALSLHAISKENGQTLWSGMASGPETLLPKQVRAEMQEFASVSANNFQQTSE